MSTDLLARYCDGETLRSTPVTIAFLADGSLQIRGDGVERVFAAGAFSFSTPLGNVPRFVRLRPAGVIELPPPALAEAVTNHPTDSISRAIHWLESRAAIAAAATGLLVTALTLTIWQGLPRLARHIAFAVPANIEEHAGKTSLAVFRQAFRPTTLDFYRQHRVQQQLDRLAAARSLHVKPRIVLLNMQTPNAFALPGGIIVVADELVQLATHDDEIAAVLAHELGHIEQRHGLQSVLQNSATLVLVSAITGDLSTLATFSASLPYLLLHRGYEREFEREADRFAVELLPAVQIDPSRLGDILAALEAARPKQGADFTYLSTHPSTRDRIQMLKTSPAPAVP